MIPSEGTHTANALDPVQRRIWRDGVELLTSTGGTEREVRSLLGELAKVHGKRQLAAAIAETQAENPANPRSYLIKMLRDRTSRANVGRTDLEDAPPPACGECNDLKKVWVPKPDSEVSFEQIQVDCPECTGGTA
jgi:hypothetical protein